MHCAWNRRLARAPVVRALPIGIVLFVRVRALSLRVRALGCARLLVLLRTLRELSFLSRFMAGARRPGGRAVALECGTPFCATPRFGDMQTNTVMKL